MSPEARELWVRANRALETATTLLATDPDASASRAYYAAFYAISAVFIAEGASFKSLRALEIAVHRDLVRSGRLPAHLGHDYTLLHDTRSTADYGGATHVSADGAQEAVDAATRLLDWVLASQPDLGASAAKPPTDQTPNS